MVQLMISHGINRLIIALALALATSSAAGSLGSVADIDLASNSEWTLSVDDGPSRAIKVPGGGFNSDLQDQPWMEMCGDGHGRRMVKDHVIYQRAIKIPDLAAGNAVVIEFGAVNHGAEVYLIDGQVEKLIASHVGPHMPFSADLTGKVLPGREYSLKVKAYPMWHYNKTVPNGFIYQEGWTNPTNGWASKFSFGIAKYVRLMVYPQVRVRDVFIKPSVSQATLTCDVWLENHSESERTVKIRSRLSSWNKASWRYPLPEDITTTVPARGQTKVTIGPVNWSLGNASYWWPNKPFREDYVPQLHNLKISLSEKGKTRQEMTRRFGFAEWAEGPYFYTVNGVRINFISDSTPEAAMGDYDCYSTSPAFLPPTGPGTGCPETWRRYMRMGICANRIHQSTPTEYMMNAADEAGFILIPESAIRGYQGQRWEQQHFTSAVKELAQACRNHPSVCFYSVQNEENPAWVGSLVDAISTEDDTRPLVFEDSEQNRPGSIFGKSGAHAYAMLHYRPAPTNSAFMIVGMGECAWNGGADQRTNYPFLESFAFDALKGRCANWAYYSGWDWINYWPNFLEGMNATKHAWKQQFHLDRCDGLDGWNSPVIRWTQQAFSPNLVLDSEFYFANGPFSTNWPTKLPVYTPGQHISRTLQVFNDAIAGEQVTLRWSLCWDSPTGPQLVRSEKQLLIKPGFHASETVGADLPNSSMSSRKLYLILESIKQGHVVFHDESVCFVVK